MFSSINVGNGHRRLVEKEGMFWFFLTLVKWLATARQAPGTVLA